MSPCLDDTDVIVVVINPNGVFNRETMIKAPSVCFCDIPVNDLGIHIKKYSRFGLSFLKSFLVPKRTNPVFYVATDSDTISQGRIVSRGNCFNDMLRVYDRLAVQIRSELKKELETSRYKALVEEFNIFDKFFGNQLLAFLKPFENGKSESDKENYYMEREWRILGRVGFELNDVHRIIVPKAYAVRLRNDVQGYDGQVTFADEYEFDDEGT